MIKVDVVIVGAGHGGAQAALALRQQRFSGTVMILGEEPELPYERPPLSKDYLAGNKAFERMLIRPASFWTDRKIEIRTSARVVAVDPGAQTVCLQGGSWIGYDHLIWAAGGHARKLTCSGHDLVGVHSVRSRADVDAMSAELGEANKIVVIGGGYIGLEAAAVLAKFGKKVIILEAQDRVLPRVAGKALSHFYEAEHRAHGVDVRLGAQVDCVVGDGTRVTGVRMADGNIIASEMVIVGIGIVPAIGPLLEAGARGGNGVTVDEQCRTSLPNVFAIGDCAMHANAFADGLPIRLESVQNANDMAATTAKVIVGRPEPYHAVPWFWSNQYDLKLQTVGLSAGHDEEVLRGDPATRSFSVIYLKQGRVVAIDAVNAVKDYVQGRNLVVAGSVVDPVKLADPTILLKELTVHRPDVAEIIARGPRERAS